MDYARRPFRDIYFSTKGVRNTLFCEHIRTFICNNSKMTFYLPQVEPIVPCHLFKSGNGVEHLVSFHKVFSDCLLGVLAV